jgi:hypothetical protein
MFCLLPPYFTLFVAVNQVQAHWLQQEERHHKVNLKPSLGERLVHAHTHPPAPYLLLFFSNHC